MPSAEMHQDTAAHKKQMRHANHCNAAVCPKLGTLHTPAMHEAYANRPFCSYTNGLAKQGLWRSDQLLAWECT